MRRLAIALIASAAAVCTAAPLWADSYAFVLRSRTIAADLTITVDNTPAPAVHGSDGYTITSISGWFEDISFGTQILPLNSTDSAIPAADPGASASNLTYKDGFGFDNLLYPSARIDSLFDWGGLLISFWGSDGYTASSPYFLRLFTDSSTTNEGFMYWSDNASSNGLPMPLIAADPTLTPIPAPEPGSFLLFGTGLLVVLAAICRNLNFARVREQE